MSFGNPLAVTVMVRLSPVMVNVASPVADPPAAAELSAESCATYLTVDGRVAACWALAGNAKAARRMGTRADHWATRFA